MKRLGRWVVGFGAAAACVTGTASAQSSTPDPGKFAAAFTVGATLGNKSSSSFGGEVDYKLGTEWEAFVEFGRMRNVASGDTDDRAEIVAKAIGAIGQRRLEGDLFRRRRQVPVPAVQWRLSAVRHTGLRRRPGGPGRGVQRQRRGAVREPTAGSIRRPARQRSRRIDHQAALPHRRRRVPQFSTPILFRRFVSLRTHFCARPAPSKTTTA